MRRKFIFCLLILSLTQLMWAKEPIVYFTSETDLARKCIEYIHKEKTAVCIASHRLSNVQVITALLKAYKKGVSVQVIVDAETVTKHSRLQLLANEGASVLVWKPEGKKKDHLHHSFCVFGNKLSWTGSYSFSLQKKFSHKESVLILEDSHIAQGFLKEFDSIKMNSCVPFLEYIKEL